MHAQHVRHMDEKRIRHSDDLLAFAKQQNARLSTAAVKAISTLALGATPVDTHTVTIGAKVYTFQTALTEADGHVLIGASATTAATNLFHAINKSGGTSGTDYANAMTANADFVATNPSAAHVTITAKVAGVRSDATTTTVASATWTGATVGSGAGATSFDTLASLKKGNSADEIKAASTASSLK